MSDSIRAYVARAPAAISGQRGHDTTLRVARTLYNGFALSHHQVLEWLRFYNARLSNKWSDRELAHKADSAERGEYDKPRGWLLTEYQSEPRRILIRAEKITGQGQKNAKKYVLATDATDISHTSCMQAHARAYAQSRSESEISVASFHGTEDQEARRIASELMRMHVDGAIIGPGDANAGLFAAVLHRFGATYYGRTDK